MNTSPRIAVILTQVATAPATLKDVKAFTNLGLSEIRDRIVSGQPAVVEEMFSNAWYDERAEQLLTLLTKWQDEGIAFEVREVAEDGDLADGAMISVEVLQNIIEAGRQ
ncbi:hypothetical protein N24_2327 [Corynebacterium suranareeae]|uniref:Uncharacterized protein n=1 Tax=Corynebacterium suranareeae TaxID=2506452 RepID=A0A160PR92_9CORY|nr:hypothetical protein [Corynebacterium suranareeae]BAU96589.1 hypothetical protein N24_2327 [Corynebacterium suranareeae]